MTVLLLLFTVEYGSENEKLHDEIYQMKRANKQRGAVVATLHDQVSELVKTDYLKTVLCHAIIMICYYLDHLSCMKICLQRWTLKSIKRNVHLYI